MGVRLRVRLTDILFAFCLFYEGLQGRNGTL